MIPGLSIVAPLRSDSRQMVAASHWEMSLPGRVDAAGAAGDATIRSGFDRHGPAQVPLPISDEQRRTLFTLMFAAFASQASIRLCDSMLPQLADDFGGAVTDAAGVVT